MSYYGTADNTVPWSVEGMLHWVEDLIIENDLVSTKSDSNSC